MVSMEFWENEHSASLLFEIFLISTPSVRCLESQKNPFLWRGDKLLVLCVYKSQSVSQEKDDCPWLIPILPVNCSPKASLKVSAFTLLR